MIRRASNSRTAFWIAASTAKISQSLPALSECERSTTCSATPTAKELDHLDSETGKEGATSQTLARPLIAVPMTKLSQLFGATCRTTHNKPTRSPAKGKPELAEPIMAMIEAEPSFDHRMVAALLAMNKNAVQRIFQFKRWQLLKRALGQGPRIEAQLSRAKKPEQRWGMTFAVYCAERTAG